MRRIKMNINLIYRNFLIIVLSIAAASAYASGKASSRATVNVTAKSVAGKKLELRFSTQPADGLVINHDGPWKLEIQDAGSIKLEKTELKRSDWKEDIGGFVVTANAEQKKSTDIKYKLIAFICTKDKTQCFREVIETTAKINW